MANGTYGSVIHWVIHTSSPLGHALSPLRLLHSGVVTHMASYIEALPEWYHIGFYCCHLCRHLAPVLDHFCPFLWFISFLVIYMVWSMLVCTSEWRKWLLPCSTVVVWLALSLITIVLFSPSDTWILALVGYLFYTFILAVAFFFRFTLASWCEEYVGIGNFSDDILVSSCSSATYSLVHLYFLRWRPYATLCSPSVYIGEYGKLQICLVLYEI